MTQPHIAGKAWCGNMFSKDKVERDFISTVQSNAKKHMGAVSPLSYKPLDKDGIQSDPKNIGFFYGKAKKTGIFNELAQRKVFIPGVGTHKDQDIYKKRPTLIFKRYVIMRPLIIYLCDSG